MAKPKIRIELKPIDVLIEVIGIFALLLLIFYVIYQYPNLPSKIPSHFNASGLPNAYSSKSSILTLPIIGIIIYTLLTILNLYPHTFNYPVEVTEKNAEQLYRLGTRLVRFLKAIVLAIFLFITYQSIKVSLNKSKGLGESFLIVTISVLAIMLIIYIIQMYRKK